MRWTAAIGAVLLVSAPAWAAEPAGPSVPAAILDNVRGQLLREFEAHLADPPAFRQRALRECRTFPEGDLFPFLFPAMAYTNLAVKGTVERPQAAERVAQLIALAIPSCQARLKPPGEKLENLKSYGNNAVYAGQLNVMLGCYRLVGGDDRYGAIHRRLSDLLHAELVRLDGLPLQSLPTASWPFDTLPVLLSLRLYDKHTGTDRSGPAVRKHLAWIRQEATDPETGLPWSHLAGATREVPRGCDLSWRIMLLAHLERPYAEALYPKYAASFWIDRGVLAGFAEWPGGRTRFQDADSGPITDGIGTAATGFGYGAAIAMHDLPRLERLCLQLPAMRLMLQEARKTPDSFASALVYDHKCVTGFLFGDACLFYSVTWQDWGLANQK